MFGICLPWSDISEYGIVINYRDAKELSIIMRLSKDTHQGVSEWVSKSAYTRRT